MPLSEFLRMAGRKIESGQHKPCPTDLSSRSENNLVELVWENGQIMMQGQSSRVTRTPALNNLPSNTSKVRDARIAKLGGVESILNDMSLIVPSRNLDLSQDDEMAPRLDALAQDYGSVLLPEISTSGVTANGMSTQNSFPSGVRNLHSNGAPSSSRARLLGLWPTPQHRQTSDALGLRVSDIISNNTSNHPSVLSGNPSQGKDIVNGSASMKMKRQNIGPPTTTTTNNSSNYLNFSHFARPANLVKAKVPNSYEIPTSGVERVDIKEKVSGANGSNRTANSGHSVGKETKDSCLPEKHLGQETSVKNDKPLIVSNTTDSTKGVPFGEKIVEPMVDSSSVGSGNSVDRVSCEQTHNSKRTFRVTEESECRSDDLETESVVVKKPTTARGTGSKRSRAAEVHNISERRRRDRINEKMRALQELIPNCNKADKASMLDDAIEYLKTLQLQVQIMSMGAGLCMPPMMFPPGMQHMHPAHFPHFSLMGMGMGMGMGFGMGMLDMNGGSPGWPIFPVSPLKAPHTNFQRMPGPNLTVYGHPGPGLPNSAPRAPSVLLTGQPPVDSAMGLRALGNGSQNAVHSGDITNTNSQLNCNTEVGSSNNQKSDQLPATNEVLIQSTVQENERPTDATATGIGRKLSEQ